MMNIPNSPPPIKNELEMALERKRSAERELENLRKMEEIESDNSTIEATNINEKKKEEQDDNDYDVEPIKEEPSIDDMFALAHAKARRLIEDTAIDDQERVDDVTKSLLNC